jgi:predicted MFS family arabinose efflux permease
VIALTLVVAWGGTTFAWTSLPILGLGAVVVLAALAFVYFEKHAADPLIPLHLFANPGFSIPTALGVVAALGMFSAISYMPTYLQMVYGLSATESGLFILPMVGGTMLMSLVSGAVVSRTGHYRTFPLLGMAGIGIALFLLSTLSSETSVWLVAACLAILGLGLGSVLQILVLIVQNVVAREELGTATSANNFFREIGATIGIALIGGLFSSQLSAALSTLDLDGLSALKSVEELTPAIVAALPAGQQETVIAAYSASLTPLFAYMVPVFIAAFVLAFFMPDGKEPQAVAATGH